MAQHSHINYHTFSDIIEEKLRIIHYFVKYLHAHQGYIIEYKLTFSISPLYQANKATGKIMKSEL